VTKNKIKFPPIIVKVTSKVLRYH